MLTLIDVYVNVNQPDLRKTAPALLCRLVVLTGTVFGDDGVAGAIWPEP